MHRDVKIPFLLTQFGSFIILEIEKRPPGSIRHSAQKQNSEAAPPPPTPQTSFFPFFSRRYKKKNGKKMKQQDYYFPKENSTRQTLRRGDIILVRHRPGLEGFLRKPPGVD
jgi:hypothetical protein